MKKSAVMTASDLAPNDDRSPESTEYRIRLRAYELYLERGQQEGHAEADWLRAEKEVLGTMAERKIT